MAILGGDMLERSDFDIGFEAGKNKIISAIEAVVWYNELAEFILPWKDKAPVMTGHILPDYREHMYDAETTADLEFIWIVAVMLYGNYGTSPRSGWIEDIDGFRKFIDEITKTDREDNGEC